MSDFDLTRYLPYLVNRTGIRIAAAFAEEFKAHGITLQMWRVLAALDHADGQRISDLAALTSAGLNVGTVDGDPNAFAVDLARDRQLLDAIVTDGG